MASNVMRVKPVRPPVKANLIIVRGRGGEEVRGEDWGRVEHKVYISLVPKELRGLDAVYDLIVLVPGMEPMKSEAVCYRGCNCLVVSSEVVMYL